MPSTFPRLAATLLLAIAPLPGVRAADIDCDMPQGDGARVVCADPMLRKLDAAWTRLRQAAIARSPELLTGWHNDEAATMRRKACGADVTCLENWYRLAIAGFDAPDSLDLEALDELRNVVENARRPHPDSAADTAMKSIEVVSTITTFKSEFTGTTLASDPHFPQAQPEDVSADEWRALLASALDDVHGNSMSSYPRSYTLVDLDGDGKRDLVLERIHHFEFGDVTQSEVWHRKGDRFAAPPASASAYLPDTYPFDFDPEWVMLRGRLFRIYRLEHAGVDELYLLRPERPPSQVPRLTIHYRYELTVAPDKSLPPALREKLNEALLQADLSTTQLRRPYTIPLCPVADDTPGEVLKASFSYSRRDIQQGDVVGDLPIKLDGRCYIGQLRETTTDVEQPMDLCLRTPEDIDARAERCYAVQGPRIPISVAVDTLPLQQ